MSLSPSVSDRLYQRERPPRKWSMHQTWRDLLFLHWRVEPERIQRTLPAGLFVDVHDGAAWIGIVPFFMRDIRPRWCPWVPGFSAFLELNVRTYVYDAAGTPGIWFYSLDCNQSLAVWGARTFYHLPYRHARMAAPATPDGTIAYSSRVKRSPWHCDVTYRLAAEERIASPGSLEFFLLERYVLFAANRAGRLFTGRVHHRPYPMVAATVTAHSSHLLAEHDFDIDESRPDHVCGSPGFVDVEVFGLESLR